MQSMQSAINCHINSKLLNTNFVFLCYKVGAVFDFEKHHSLNFSCKNRQKSLNSVLFPKQFVIYETRMVPFVKCSWLKPCENKFHRLFYYHVLGKLTQSKSQHDTLTKHWFFRRPDNIAGVLISKARKAERGCFVAFFFDVCMVILYCFSTSTPESTKKAP